MIGLTTKYAECRITFILYLIRLKLMISFSELIRNIRPIYIFFGIYRQSPHKIMIPIGPAAKEALIRP